MTQLHVQFTRSGEGVGILTLGGEPPANGMYMVVADITPLDGGKSTKLDVYSTQVWRAIPNALKHWSNATNMGCPDFQEKPWFPGMDNTSK